MLIINKPVYYCDHCNKKALTKHTIAKHEPICYGNPENVPACFNGCEHFEVIAESKTLKSFFCNKFNKAVHTKGAEVYGLTERYPEHFEESTLMPKHCIGFHNPHPPIEHPF